MVWERLKANAFIAFGRAGMDLYADPPGAEIESATRYVSALGGSAANIAAGIAKLGAAASLISTVSDDAVGRFVVRELGRYGVDIRHVAVVGGGARNSLAIVETRDVNCQSIIYRNGAADFQLNVDQIAAVDWARYGALIVTGTSCAVEPSRAACFEAMRAARAAGLAIVLDVDYRPYSWASGAEAAATMRRAAEAADIVVGNDEEFEVMAGADGLAYARSLARSTAAVVVYKQGERGAIGLSREGEFATPVFPVRALKPTGAGDAFMGGFLTSLASGLSMGAAMRRGSAAAAIVVTRVGCAPASPTSAELENFLAQHPE